MNIGFEILQVLLLISMAPLVRGVIARLKARIQNRQGASIWRPYAEIAKLLRKQDMVPPSASFIFRLAPIAVFVSIALTCAFIPVLHDSAMLGVKGDFVVLVYLFAFSRFFLLLGAMDGGSSFGGMGASREVLVSALAEMPLLLGLTSAAIAAHDAGLTGIVRWTAGQDFFHFSPVHALACAALVLVAIAETGRIPVDNPTTHLELTMIHEAMILEYSGPSLALIEWAGAIKLTVIISLLIAIFFPWGIAAGLTLGGVTISLLAFLLKFGLTAAAIAVLESSVAKLRMYLVPNFLGVALALAILAVAFTALMR